MEFKYGTISEKRCKEIDEMNIVCPYPYDCGQTKFRPRKTEFVYNEDESIMFCLGFSPIPAESYYARTYIMFIDGEYIYIYIYTDSTKTADDEYKHENGIDIYHFLYEIRFEEEMIKNKDRKKILHLLKQMIPIRCKESKFFKDEVEYKIDLFYNGEEVK